MSRDAERVLEAVQRTTRASGVPLVLAVSGGLDSMVLLDAVARVAPAMIGAVATFDHGTGVAATTAVRHVQREASARGLRCVTASLDDVPGEARGGNEVRWREARFAFLRHHATECDARIATGHHADDHLETVLMRVLRGSGARGLAGLLAPSAIVRPLLDVGRAEIAAYATCRSLRWCEDPSNASRRHLRNRVRHDLLPALTAAAPTLRGALFDIAHRAARWRVEVEALAAQIAEPGAGGDSVAVRAAALAGLDHESLAVLWGAIAGLAGCALDRRGIARLAAFAASMPHEGMVPVSGGWCMEAGAGVYLLRKERPEAPGAAALPDAGTLRWGRFTFRRSDGRANDDAWRAVVPAGSEVRRWTAGDRFARDGGTARRVKRWLSDAGVHGEDRRGWPVVVAGDDVVWIPGVRRSDAATERSGRPVRHYVCERIHG